MTTVALLWEPGLAPTDPLFDAAVAHVVRKLGRAKPIAADSLPSERGALIRALDDWADGAVDWRGELRRYCEAHIPVHVRPRAGVNATLRRLHAAGIRLVWAAQGPPESTRVLLHHLGVARLVEETAYGPTPEAAVAALGAEAEGAVIVRGLEDLLALAEQTAVAT